MDRPDAIYVNRTSGLVRMVKLTTAKTYHFKIDHFLKILKLLTQNMTSFEIKKFEIVFLIPNTNIATFRFNDSINMGKDQLNDFNWIKNEEMRNVSVLGFDSGLQNL